MDFDVFRTIGHFQFHIGNFKARMDVDEVAGTYTNVNCESRRRT